MTYTGINANSLMSVYIDGLLSTAVPRSLGIVQVRRWRLDIGSMLARCAIS